MTEHVDVLIVGAGISGIGAAWHLQDRLPGKSYALLEARDAVGGTWDLFRYPGIRSDSDMFTLGYSFRPWTESKSIADGPSILNYLHETIADHDIGRHIRFRHRAIAASWSSKDARWTVTIERGAEKTRDTITCHFLMMCSGYYNYARGYTPEWPGTEDFAGRIVHPQFWPADLDYAGKRVVVIGSGATAVTLVPEMAKSAGHVVMLQRSPTYIVSRPSEDALGNWLRAKLPSMTAYRLTRWKNVFWQLFFFNLARKRPDRIKGKILEAVRAELGPDYDIGTHFTPRYNPWDQRLCLVPDGDLFKSIRDGKAEIVTDTIERFTETGLKLASGNTLDADIVVTATGLDLQLMSGLAISVDGAPADASKSMQYKGMMYSGIPNLASSFGYTNASWTLKADLTCEYMCRLLKHMDRTATRIATPMLGGDVAEAPFLDFTSGYVQRGIDRFPRQGDRKPWKVHQNYAKDLVSLRYGKVDDGVMCFTKAAPASAPVERAREPAE